MKRARRTAGPAVVISCEHAGNSIPPAYQHHFASRAARQALDSHRGWDPGSLELGKTLARVLSAPLTVCRFSRLLIEPNRSPESPQLFSEWTRGLPSEQRDWLQHSLYVPHREEVIAQVRRALQQASSVVHISVHTFTAVWKGVRRSTDIGLLYDPDRNREVAVSRAWRRALQRKDLELRVHLNRPYRGWTDGLTTALRRQFRGDEYLGLELEVNQRFPAKDARRWHDLQQLVAQTFRTVLEEMCPPLEIRK